MALKKLVSKILNYELLDSRYKKLLVEAKKIMKTGYNPQSGSIVGAALLTSDGKIISASNIVPKDRNANVCAERSAITKANSMGRRKFVAIAVIGISGRKKPDTHMFTPCGTCRGVIAEFAKISGKDIDVIMSNLKMDRIIIMPISSLLPMPFE